jgi:hypothetical protein
LENENNFGKNWDQNNLNITTYSDPNDFMLLKLKNIIYEYQLQDQVYPKYGLAYESVVMLYQLELSRSYF